MKKILLSIVLLLTIFLTGCGRENNKIFLFKINNETEVTIVQYNGTYSDLVIPDTHNEYNVVEIDMNVFSTLSRLNTLTLSSNLVKIGESAFSYCENLNEITISESSKLNSIERLAFSNCSSLEMLDLKNCETLNYIGERTFLNCTSLKNIYIPISVTEIDSRAFAGCSNLKIHFEGDVIPSTWASNFNPENCEIILNSVYQEK